MKKSLIALAVLAASGAAMAQSSVTVYGVADIWFGSSKASVTSAGVTTGERQTVLESGGVSGSRIGFKGTEDLGGGLKANFQLEQGFSLDTGAQGESGKAFNRDAWVGLSGGFGATKFGRSYTAYDDVRGTNNNTFDSALSATPWVGYAGRANNQIHYSTPTFGGFSGALSYGLGENKTATSSAGSTFALHAKYENGPLNVAFAHQAEKAGNADSLGYLSGINDVLADIGEPAIVNAAGDKAKYNLLTAGYDFGSFKLLASYNNAKLSFANGDDAIKFNEYQIGADIPLGGAMTLAVGYGQSKAKAAGQQLFKSRAYSAALAYSLSKRTTVYTGFNNTKITTPLADVSAKSTTLALGLKHTF